VILIFCQNVRHFQRVSVIIGNIENTFLPTTCSCIGSIFTSSQENTRWVVFYMCNRKGLLIRCITQKSLNLFQTYISFIARSKYFIKWGNETKITVLYLSYKYTNQVNNHPVVISKFKIYVITIRNCHHWHP
jgi:hypothetical protein